MSGVMGFSEISYDELMDVNGGFSLYAKIDSESARVGVREGHWQGEVGYKWASGFYASGSYTNSSF